MSLLAKIKQYYGRYIVIIVFIKIHLIIDEPSQRLDLQHVGLMGSKLVDETVRCSVVSE